MYNREEAQRQNNEYHIDAQREQIRQVLLDSKIPVTVAHIVKQTGFREDMIRERLLDMIEDGEAREIAWRYTI